MSNRYVGVICRRIKEFLGRGDLIALFFFAVIVRLIFLSQVVDQIGFNGLARFSPDAELYINTAQAIISGADSNENGIFTFGPGYPFFLVLNFLIWGNRISFIILIQMALSAGSALLVYRLAKIIGESYSVALIAAILFALSYTSIALSIIPLSDALYVFLFLVGTIAFLEGLNKRAYGFMIFSGVATGVAILTRSIGQFWPLIMLAYTWLVRPDTALGLSFRRRYWPAVLGAGISIAILVFWIGRNFIVHDAPIVSLAGPIGAAKIAGQAAKNMENEAKGIAQYCDESAKRDSSIILDLQAIGYKYDVCYAKAIFMANPFGVIGTYLRITWENINDICYYHRALFPNNKGGLIKWEYYIKNHLLNYVNFALCLAGFGLLLMQRKYRQFIILFTLYLYYAALVGLTLWQGSRIFFPGQIAAVILIAIVIVNLRTGIARLIEWLRSYGKFISTREE
jgi:hypothetical protein